MMHIEIPTDCGNSPRVTIIGDLVANWAQGDVDAVAAWMSENVTWTIVGGQTYQGIEALGELLSHPVPDRVEVLSVINHGRLAACDGYLETQGARMHFSHTFRFAGAVKTAKVAEVRTYLIPSASDR